MYGVRSFLLKHGCIFQCVGELQLVSGCSDLFHNREGADALVVELLLWSRKMKVVESNQTLSPTW